MKVNENTEQFFVWETSQDDAELLRVVRRDAPSMTASPIVLPQRAALRGKTPGMFTAHL